MYAANPPRDVVSMPWIAYAQDGEIHILRRDHPEVRVALLTGRFAGGWPAVEAGDDVRSRRPQVGMAVGLCIARFRHAASGPLRSRAQIGRAHV